MAEHLSKFALIIVVFAGSEVLAEELTPAQVHQHVGALAADVEQIRLVIGKRLPRSRDFRLEEVEPRQVFFQSQTLFRKCNQLAQELAGVSRQAAPYPPDERATTLNDVQEVITLARGQLKYVRDTLGIEEAPLPRFERRRTSSDVMRDIIEAGYVLNRLIEQTRDWSQIYDRVYQTITYMGGVLPEAARYPAMETFECCKVPQDVYARLALTMEAARPAAEKVDLALIRIILNKQAEGGASTETVYDLTTTLVTDFGELSLRLEGEDIAGPDYERPAKIYPSHVFQLAGVLERQVAALSN